MRCINLKVFVAELAQHVDLLLGVGDPAEVLQLVHHLIQDKAYD